MANADGPGSAQPRAKLLVVGNHDFGKRTGVLEPAGHDVAAGILTVDTDPPLVLTHVPMGTIPPGWVNVHEHVHNNEPLRETPHINVCVEHTGFKPVALDGVLALAKRLLTGGGARRNDHPRPDPKHQG